MAICPKCGLPEELCICKQLSKSEEKITVRRVKRKFGKWVTLVEGIETDTEKIGKELKSSLACGGTVKGKVIELQGDWLKKIKDKLVKLGFKEEQIEIIG